LTCCFPATNGGAALAKGKVWRPFCRLPCSSSALACRGPSSSPAPTLRAPIAPAGTQLHPSLLLPLGVSLRETMMAVRQQVEEASSSSSSSSSSRGGGSGSVAAAVAEEVEAVLRAVMGVVDGWAQTKLALLGPAQLYLLCHSFNCVGVGGRFILAGLLHCCPLLHLHGGGGPGGLAGLCTCCATPSTAWGKVARGSCRPVHFVVPPIQLRHSFDRVGVGGWGVLQACACCVFPYQRGGGWLGGLAGLCITVPFFQLHEGRWLRGIALLCAFLSQPTDSPLTLTCLPL